ncbi:MAG: hypothetical protein IPP45_12030 [Sphingomonadales bacterium]|nr:hypothetical protein [Sphingomonadales bacterium]MBL0116053.1 hypothetical protein [Sphingomonadales bacterium]
MGVVPAQALVWVYDPHLTFTASEDIPANGHGGSANRMEEQWQATKTG